MKYLGILAGAAAMFVAANASATVIDFEDQPAGPCCFGSVAGPATIIENLGGGLTVTFSGGVILTDESSESTDTSNVYATASTNFGAPPGFTNPLTITFSKPLQNFQLDVLNALAGNYELLDNAGNTDFFNLATTGGSVQTVGFAATGTAVELLYLNGSTKDAATVWDFAIDNVNFVLAPTTVPEPSTWAMLFSGLALLGFAVRRRQLGVRATS